MQLEYKGYILQQSSYNNHYMIIKADSEEVVMHVSYSKKLTVVEAKQAIELYIKFAGEL